MIFRECQNCRQQFVIQPEDTVFYQKIHVPQPTFCPDCRLQRRFTWKNARSIYKRRCDLCSEEKIGVYAPGKPYKVYCAGCWWSDKWEASEYGQDYDPSRPSLSSLMSFYTRSRCSTALSMKTRWSIPTMLTWPMT